MLTNKLQLTGIIQGPTGETGKSAYQHAVDNGFVGTEQEWIASLKGEIGKSSYEYAVDKGYQGSEEEFSQIIKDTLDAKDVVKTSREEVLAAKEATLTAKQSVDTSKTEVLSAKEAVDAAKNHVDQLNAQFETASKETIAQIKSDGTKAVSDITAAKESALTGIQQEGTTQTSKVTETGNTAVGNITTTRDESVAKIQQEGTTQTSKVNETGNTAVGNVNTTKDQALTQIQNKGSEMLNAIGTGAVEEITGSDIAVDGTAQGSAILKELKGGTKQEKTNGYQLFDASKLPTKSQSGATVTNNGDGSFTISGSGNLSETFVLNHTYSHEETLNLLKVGAVRLNQNGNTIPQVLIQLIKENSKIMLQLTKDTTGATITQEMLNVADCCLRIWVYDEVGVPIKTGTIRPMLYQDGDGTWEPFTGAAPSPNPDYPQEIKPIGGNDWFDGELVKGFYSSENGIFKESSTTVTSKNAIRCNSGDSITLKYEEQCYEMFLRYFDKNLNYLGCNTVIHNNCYEITETAKTNSYYVHIGLTGTLEKTIDPKKVTVLVNGKYAVKVKTHGKNLLNEVEPGCYVHSDGQKYVDSRYIRSKELIEVEENKKYIVSYNGTKVDVSFLSYNKDKTYRGHTMGNTFTIPSGCSYIALNFLVGSNVITNIQLEESAENTPYEPYKESISYIPLDSPLYEGDRIYLEDGELWEYRENTRVVLDGSEDEGWFDYAATSLIKTKRYCTKQVLLPADKLLLSSAKANKFYYLASDNDVNHFRFSNGVDGYTQLVVCASVELATDVPTWKSWLQSNPIEVVYKLATPTLKKLGSAEAFNLRTFDERTYIEVSNSKELGTENTFIVPKNQLGGLATDAFAETKKQNDEFNQLYDKLYPMSEEFFTFGFIEHMNVLSPSNRIEYVCSNKNYSPMSINLTSHETNYGSWAKFPTLVENKPYMVKPTGEADYALNPDDYTKKLDGSSSDVANQDYNGGAFSKFIKIYVKRWVDGNDRHVRFSYYPLRGYEPCGFIDTDGREMDYVWLPMFYGSTVSGKMRSLSGLQPDINQNTDTQNTNIKAFSDRAAFFAGPIIETIKDMLYMLFKTTDLQAACGNGNSSGYNSASSPYYGVLPNAVVNGGQFYGSSDGKSLNKIFHSIVLGSYQQYQRDPYYLCVNGRYKVSTDYTYDVTGAKYVDTGIDSETVDANKWLYPSKCKVVDKFGNIPVGPWSGSTSTGYCDGIYHPNDKNFTAVVLRFGDCSVGSSAGLACSPLDYSAANAYWALSASVLLRAPATA